MWIELTKDWDRGDQQFKKGQVVEMDDASGKAFIKAKKGKQVEAITNAVIVTEQEEQTEIRPEPTTNSKKTTLPSDKEE